MDRKREIIEIVCIAASVAAVTLFLSWHGRSHVAVLPSPQVRLLQEPRQAFDVWENSAVHGRVLFLFDRHLNADPVEQNAAAFTADDFGHGYSLKSLCEAIGSDGYGVPLDAKSCSVETLNRFLQMPDFHDRWRERHRDIGLSDAAERLIRLLRDAGGPSSLGGKMRHAVIRLNRFLLEATYPRACPRSREYFVSDDNYIHQAVQAYLIRKVYHVIPDAAWTEVERTLSGYPLVTYSRGMFRMIIGEAVPVYILRMQDIPAMREPVLIAVNGDYWNGPDVDRITELLSNRTLSSDLITLSGNIPGDRIQSLSALYGKSL